MIIIIIIIFNKEMVTFPVKAPSPIRPKVVMIYPEVALIDYNSDFTVACKVSGYPKPAITWHDEAGAYLRSEVLSII